MWRSPATARCHQPQLTWVEVRRDALSEERRARYSVHVVAVFVAVVAAFPEVMQSSCIPLSETLTARRPTKSHKSYRSRSIASSYTGRLHRPVSRRGEIGSERAQVVLKLWCMLKPRQGRREGTRCRSDLIPPVPLLGSEEGGWVGWRRGA